MDEAAGALTPAASSLRSSAANHRGDRGRYAQPSRTALS